MAPYALHDSRTWHCGLQSDECGERLALEVGRDLADRIVLQVPAQETPPVRATLRPETSIEQPGMDVQRRNRVSAHELRRDGRKAAVVDRSTQAEQQHVSVDPVIAAWSGTRRAHVHSLDAVERERAAGAGQRQVVECAVSSPRRRHCGRSTVSLLQSHVAVLSAQNRGVHFVQRRVGLDVHGRELQ